MIGIDPAAGGLSTGKGLIDEVQALTLDTRKSNSLDEFPVLAVVLERLNR